MCDVTWLTIVFSGISGEKVEIDPVTNQKASTKFWIRQKPISIDSDHLCACDLVEERSPSEYTEAVESHFFSLAHALHSEDVKGQRDFLQRAEWR